MCTIMYQTLLGNRGDCHAIYLIAYWLEIKEKEFLALVLFFTIVFQEVSLPP